MRQLLQELRQNNFGVITKETIKMMTSVERNAENMVEVAQDKKKLVVTPPQGLLEATREKIGA